MISQLYLTPIAFIIAAVLLVGLWLDGVSVQIAWLRHAATGVTVLLFALALFDRWIWRWRLLNGWFAKRPVLCGTWNAELKTEWIDPVTGEQPGPIDGYMAIRQTFSKLSMRLMTRESSSETVAEKIIQSDDGIYKVVMVYTNQPKLELRGKRSEIHNGAFILTVHGQPPESLNGHYWTDRSTRGTMRLSNRKQRIFSTYEEAYRAFKKVEINAKQEV